MVNSTADAGKSYDLLGPARTVGSNGKIVYRFPDTLASTPGDPLSIKSANRVERTALVQSERVALESGQSNGRVDRRPDVTVESARDALSPASAQSAVDNKVHVFTENAVSGLVPASKAAELIPSENAPCVEASGALDPSASADLLAGYEPQYFLKEDGR
jgi:hypothetical protein